MTQPDLATLSTALAPVREALLARARAEADHLIETAEREAAAALGAAEKQARALRAEGRAQGEADAAVALASERARARRRARAVVLRAQRTAYERLQQRVRDEVRGLRDEPGYPGLLADLTALARAELGPQARIVEHPHGGVVAELDGRRVNHSLDVLAERAVARLGAEVEELWQP